MFQIYNEEGSVFWAVLAVLLAVSLLFSTVVFYGIWHRTQNRRFLQRQQAKYLALATIERTKYELDRLNPASRSVEDLAFEDSLAGRRYWRSELQPWGCFWRAVCFGSSRSERWNTDVLIGHIPPANFQYALHLFGPPYPLVVAGQTKIIGDVSVGPAGVTSGRFHGRSFQDTALVHGNIINDPLPPKAAFDWSVWEKFESHIQKLHKHTPVHSDRTLIIDDSFEFLIADSTIVIDNDIVFNKHRQLEITEPVYLFATGNISISSSTRLYGRWFLYAARSITVKDSAQLAGVILHAPQVSISGAASFSGQIIADTLLEITGDARTVFPTTLWIKGSESITPASRLELSSTARCEGIGLATISKDRWISPLDRDNAAELVLNKGSVWVGYLYTDGRAQIQGTVLGSVVANLLFLSDPPTTYINWLVDSQINRRSWQGFAILPAFFEDNVSWGIAEVTPFRRVKRIRKPIG